MLFVKCLVSAENHQGRWSPVAWPRQLADCSLGMLRHSPGSWGVKTHRHAGIWSLWNSVIATPGCLLQRELCFLLVSVKAV